MTAFYNEHDRFAATWLRNLIAAGEIAEGTVDERGIEEITGADLEGYERVHLFAGIAGWDYALRLAGWPAGREVWTGSCPCQPFSCSGTQRGEGDPRHLWPRMRKLISERRPSTVFGEQVASASGRDWIAGVRSDLEELAYAVGIVDLCAASVGAPHARQRLFWVAHAGSSQMHKQHKRPGGHSKSGRNTLDARTQAISSAARKTDADGTPGFLPSPWPPGPGQINEILPMDDGLPLAVGKCIGNAIVPAVAAEFIRAFLEINQ